MIVCSRGATAATPGEKRHVVGKNALLGGVAATIRAGSSTQPQPPCPRQVEERVTAAPDEIQGARLFFPDEGAAELVSHLLRHGKAAQEVDR